MMELHLKKKEYISLWFDDDCTSEQVCIVRITQKGKAVFVEKRF